MKSFADIAWKVDETTYRNDPALSYSILSRYEREGFHNLATLFDKIDSPSLLFGSMVDCLMTDSKEAFDERFFVADLPDVSPSTAKVLYSIHQITGASTLDEVSEEHQLTILNDYAYHTNWRDKTRLTKLKEEGDKYYRILASMSPEKALVDSKTYVAAYACAQALKESPETKWYFTNSPFDTHIERLYQLKFRGEHNGIAYRCMADLIVVDHEKKTIQPVDLKTSSHYEDEFPKSFVTWRYDIQARLYWRLIKAFCEADDYFKEFKVLPYKFIVINRKNQTPLVWDFDKTEEIGNFVFTYPSGEKKLFRDPYVIGEELHYYLSKGDAVKFPRHIKTGELASNDILKWFEHE